MPVKYKVAASCYLILLLPRSKEQRWALIEMIYKSTGRCIDAQRAMCLHYVRVFSALWGGLAPAHKVLLVSADGVEDEALVGVWDVCALVALLVAEVHLADHRLHLQPGLLHRELHVDCLIWLQPHLRTHNLCLSTAGLYKLIHTAVKEHLC